MGLYAVTYIHRDLQGWQEHQQAHIVYLVDLLRRGILRASGPLKTPSETPHEEEHSALLIMSANSEAELREIIAQDPYSIHGQVSEMHVAAWDPIFGAFHDDSSMAGKIDWEKGRLKAED
ncbi:YciI family protein [Deinococcus sp. UYEF24]